MRKRMTLEELEPRLALSSGIALAGGEVLAIHQDTQVPSVNLAAGATLSLDPGVHLDVVGGTSDLAGTIRYGSPACWVDFSGGTVVFHSGDFGTNPNPTDFGSLYFSGGVDALFLGGVFRASVYVGMAPLAVWSKATATVAAPVTLAGVDLYNFATTNLVGGAQLVGSGGAPGGQAIVAEAGTLSVQGEVQLQNLRLLGGAATGATPTVALAPAASLTVTTLAPAIYLTGPASLASAAGATLDATVLVGPGDTGPYSAFALTTTGSQHEGST